jgi:hypothetical protein
VGVLRPSSVNVALAGRGFPPAFKLASAGQVYAFRDHDAARLNHGQFGQIPLARVPCNIGVYGFHICFDPYTANKD